ncbi:Protein zwilch homolog [Caenorhabditis elegans]|uniref:Isoform b of Protein zwilch homolog n=2 Tax=Caenorhabditis elegans TaxID=6239 RepID=Q95XP9-2|nr:Protein zwilch homolog [Caenorhabditis elegans]CCE67248.1 Protein zwilch homolog [Caenorhabditis elegans]|eukprot:NP_001249151.1 Protein zwilch homolog [Caenorhabditis elegans]
MPLTIEQLKQYNEKMAAKGEEDDAPAPVLLLDKYRVRVLPLTSIPFVMNHSSVSQLSLSSEDVLVVDFPSKGTGSGAGKAEKKMIFKKKIEPMEDSFEDKENVNEGGPLMTSFLTLEKLRKGMVGDVEIIGYECETSFFDANPIPLSDGVSLQRYIRLNCSEHFSPSISTLPVWISTTSSKFPSICWLAAGRTNRNVQFAAATRVLGHFNNENSERVVKQLNQACGTSQLNKYRAVYEEIRKIATENRPAPGEVTIDVRWSTKSTLVLLEHPDNAADCTIKIDLGWGDKRFFVDDEIFEQLFFVLNLADVLANPDNEVIFPMAPPANFDDLVQEMDALVEASSREDNVFVSNEKGGDITDKVWNIVRKCNDVKQVTLLFRNFLQALAYGKIKSHAQERNKSHLASLIRISKSSEFKIPVLERLSTIDMMMEIGVESLRRRVIDIFSSQLLYPSDELEFILQTCENDLPAGNGAMNSAAISLLPITMALATANRIYELLNEKDHVILPDLTRRILQKYTASMIEKSRRGETETEYTFETTLPLLRMYKEGFMSKRPCIWTCENSNTVGANVQARVLTSLELQPSLEHINRLVNDSRPVWTATEEKPAMIKDLNADYTVVHTIFSYLPKM